MPGSTQEEVSSNSLNQTSDFVAAAGGLGTALAAPGAVVGYTLSNMFASRSSSATILTAIKNNPSLLFASTTNVAAKLSLASTRVFAIPYANRVTQSLPPTQQDLATAAMMSVAELPSAAAELLEIKKSSAKTYAEILATAGKETADKARLLVNLKSPSTWSLFFACTLIKNYPLNYVGARNTRLANGENNKKELQNKSTNNDKGSLNRVITATSELVVSSTIAGAALQGPLYRSARGYSIFELVKSIPHPRNLAVGAAKGLAHVPIGVGMFGLMELARTYETHSLKR